MSGKDPIATAMAAFVEAGKLAGAATLVWRDGQVVQTAAVGWRDMEAKRPIERSTLFRIASMTKPITSTAALMCLRRGAIRWTNRSLVGRRNFPGCVSCARRRVRSIRQIQQRDRSPLEIC